MKLLIPVLLATAFLGCFALDNTTVAAEDSSSGAPDTTTPIASTGTAGTAGTGATEATTQQNTGTNSTIAASVATTGTAGTAGTGATDATTQQATTTTTAPLILTTFPVSNSLEPLDAKSILQHAVQLDQQIQTLNNNLKEAQANVDPTNSPLFAQLTAFSANITAQNATLQAYISRLQGLNSTQTDIDRRVNSATDTFTCFSQSSCVTDVPTTAEPTSPGPTPSVSPCTATNLIAKETSQNYNFPAQQNVEKCSVSVTSATDNYNVTVLVNVTIAGNASLTLVETRTGTTVTLNSTKTNYNFAGFQQVTVTYFADPRGSIQFDFDYIEVNNCLLDCHSPNGTCKTSLSGVQYCECQKCQFSGDHCEIEMKPCQSKQQRLCGEKNVVDNEQKPYGTCYVNPCFDQCYACSCSAGAVNPDSEQSCTKPDNNDFPTPPPPPTDVTCPTTSAPSTTTALLLTSSAAPSGATEPVTPSSPSSVKPDSNATSTPVPSTVPSSTEPSTEVTSPTIPTTTCTTGTEGCD